MGKATEISNKLTQSIPKFQELGYNTELFAAQLANALLMARVFSGGANDINEQPLKPYTKEYAKFRKKQGRQIEKKDLILTGALFENVQVGTSNNKPATGFLNERNADIGGYQEEQNGSLIFILSDDEREEVNKQAAEFIINGVKDIIKGWS